MITIKTTYIIILFTVLNKPCKKQVLTAILTLVLTSLMYFKFVYFMVISLNIKEILSENVHYFCHMFEKKEIYSCKKFYTGYGSCSTRLVELHS
jgi:hypothetical protein